MYVTLKQCRERPLSIVASHCIESHLIFVVQGYTRDTNLLHWSEPYANNRRTTRALAERKVKFSDDFVLQYYIGDQISLIRFTDLEEFLLFLIFVFSCIIWTFHELPSTSVLCTEARRAGE